MATIFTLSVICEIGQVYGFVDNGKLVLTTKQGDCDYDSAVLEKSDLEALIEDLIDILPNVKGTNHD
jgi:hypothetical protein